jgi:hypothetical protein
MCAQKGWVKEGPGDEGALPVNGPPAVSTYTTLPYSPCSPWLQVEWKKTVLEFDITAAKRVRIPIKRNNLKCNCIKKTCRVKDTAVLHESTVVTKRTSLFGQETAHWDSVIITFLSYLDS